MNYGLSFLLIFVLFSCSQIKDHDINRKISSFDSKKIEILTYNVENLFDTKHDFGKNDYTYLPQKLPEKSQKAREEYCKTIENYKWRKECENADWTDEKLQIKLGLIEKVIRHDRKNLPDVITLVEVENENVVNMLKNRLGYENMAITNSPDERGIDVALIWNEKSSFTKNVVKYHRVNSPTSKIFPTRDILEVEFHINNEKLSLFVNHWPSQHANATNRAFIADKVMKIARDRMKKGNHVILTGDFNTVDTDFPHPFYNRVVESHNKKHEKEYYRLLNDEQIKELKSKDQVVDSSSSLILSDHQNKLDRAFKMTNPHKYLNYSDYKSLPENYSFLVDIHTTYEKWLSKEGYASTRKKFGNTQEGKDKTYQWKNDKLKKLAPGTYFYNTQWNLLDRFFVSRSLLNQSGVEVEIGSYKTIVHDFMLTNSDYKYVPFLNDKGAKTIIPKRYNYKKSETMLDPSELGYSDHFPISITIKTE